MGPARGNCGPEDIAAQSPVAMHKRAAKEPAGSENLCCAGCGENGERDIGKNGGRLCFPEETLVRTKNLRDSDCALSEANYIIGIDTNSAFHLASARSEAGIAQPPLAANRGK